MTDKTLENKLVEFYSHYRTLTSLINFFSTSLLSDDADEISRSEIDVMLETIAEKTDGKLELLNEIINEFQNSYCKLETELV